MEGWVGEAWAHGDLMLPQAGKGWKGRWVRSRRTHLAAASS